jgi:hypothetical protein
MGNALVIRCRQIQEDDIDRVTDLLTEGFSRKRDYWRQALQRLANHPTPAGLPKYGYVLDDGGRLVGVILLIFTTIMINGEDRIRCNVSSWYVEAAYRGYASILAGFAVRHKSATFFNVSPAPQTWQILEKQGFVTFATGAMIAAPALSRSPSEARVYSVATSIRPGPDLTPAETEMLLDHQRYGCLSLICEVDDQRHPFVFGLDRRYLGGLLGIAHVVFCRDLRDVVRFAGPVGRFLTRRGYPFIKFNSNGPMRGIVGIYFGGRPKYQKGADQMPLGDVAYSEQVMFGY